MVIVGEETYSKCEGMADSTSLRTKSLRKEGKENKNTMCNVDTFLSYSVNVGCAGLNMQ
jgi:hypothetical protein